MGILRKALSAANSKKSDVAAKAVTVVPVGASVQGDLILDAQLHLDGSFDGFLDCSGTLVVGKNGRCRGRLRAEQVLVSGTLEGDLVCDKLQILAGGRVSGRVFCDQFLLDDRGQFTGQRSQAGEQPGIIDDAQSLLEQPVEPVTLGEEVTLDNLLDSLPTQVRIQR